MPVGREADGREHLQEHAGHDAALLGPQTGVRYPYAKYSQVVVQDFIFGGMENISATTLTDIVLYDERARIDADARLPRSRTRSRTSGSATCSPAATGRTAG